MHAKWHRITSSSGDVAGYTDDPVHDAMAPVWMMP
jgi:hypothetical protein